MSVIAKENEQKFNELNDACHKAVLQFRQTDSQLRTLCDFIQSEMRRGIQDQSSSLAMLPCYLFRIEKSALRPGTYYAFDLGGTNFRVLRLVLSKDLEITNKIHQSYPVPTSVMNGSASELFDYLAVQIKKFYDAQAFEGKENVDAGFTFSFPVKNSSLANGILLHWTKGYSVSGMENQNVCNLLQKALNRVGLSHMRVVALCNDTVGTMAASQLVDSSTRIGVIFGTGFNICYWEDASLVNNGLKDKKVAVNIEMGALGPHSGLCDLSVSRTPYDDILDAKSQNAGKQLFEKMIGGMYLGEIARLAIIDILGTHSAFACAYSKSYSFSSGLVSIILSDQSQDLHVVKETLKHFAKIDLHLTYLLIIQRICSAVIQRAAELGATALAAVLSMQGESSGTIAVDGSVFEFMPSFSSRIREVLKATFNISDIKLSITRDGSGTGAGVIAAFAVAE